MRGHRRAGLQVQRGGVGDLGAFDDFGFGLKEVFARGSGDEGGVGGEFGFELGVNGGEEEN